MDFVNLHFKEIGKGATGIVILHGLFGMGRNWTTVAKGLLGNYRILLVDLRNHGSSPWVETMEYPLMANDVAQLIESQFSNKVYVIGHSMGGKVAMTLACRRPDLVKKLVIIDIAPTTYQHRYQLQIKAMLDMNLRAFTRRAQGEQLLAEYIGNYHLARFLCSNLAPSKSGLGWEWQLNIRAIAANLKYIVGFPALEKKQIFFDPSLFVAGENSKYIRPSHIGQIRCLFPDAKQALITNAGHWIHAEKPDELTATLKNFLADSQLGMKDAQNHFLRPSPEKPR